MTTQIAERFHIDYMKPGPEGGKYAAIIGFTADIGEREHATVTRDWKNGKGEWQKSHTAEIDGPARVRVKSAFLKMTKDGSRAFVQIDGLQLPKALADAIAESAINTLAEQAPAKEKKGGRA